MKSRASKNVSQLPDGLLHIRRPHAVRTQRTFPIVVRLFHQIADIGMILCVITPESILHFRPQLLLFRPGRCRQVDPESAIQPSVGIFVIASRMTRHGHPQVGDRCGGCVRHILHHSADPYPLRIHAQILPCRIGRGKQFPGQTLGDDSHGKTGIHISLYKRLSREKTEGKHVPEPAVHVSRQDFLASLVAGQVYPHPAPSAALKHGNLIQMGKILQQRLRYEIRDSGIAGCSIRTLILRFHRFDHQHAVPVVFRINRSGLHIINDKQNHHQSNGKSRSHNVNRREQPVLFQHDPCLSEINPYHIFCLFC